MASTSTIVFILNINTQYTLHSCYIIFLAGIIGNALTILIFTRLSIFRNHRCAFYLTVEAIVDTIYVSTYSINAIIQIIYGYDLGTYSLVWCRLRLVLFQTCILISLSTICFAACDQFFSTCYRLNLRHICTLKLARYQTIVASSLWFLHSIVSGLFMNIQPSVGCVISNSIWASYSTVFFYPILYGISPIMFSATFSLLAYRNVRRIVRRQIPIARRRFDRQMTSMVLIRILFFVIFSLPFAIYRVYGINTPITPSNSLQNVIRRLIQTIFVSFFTMNFASNFYIFTATSSRYRQQVRYILIKKCWHRCKKHLFCFNYNQIGPVSTILRTSDNAFES